MCPARTLFLSLALFMIIPKAAPGYDAVPALWDGLRIVLHPGPVFRGNFHPAGNEPCKAILHAFRKVGAATHDTLWYRT